MVGTRNSAEEAAFNAAVAQAVEALMPDLRTRLFDEFRQAHPGSRSGGDAAPTMLEWLEKFGKQKPKPFSSANSPVDAENWIAHIEKIFEVLGCADEFKTRLASYKLEGDALSWWKSFKQVKGDDFISTLTWQAFREVFYLQYFPRSEQQKFEREYHNIKQYDNELSGDFMRRFLRLASFLGTRAGTQEEQAMKFKWALSDWILESLVNTDFTDIAMVADAARNVEILRERTRSNKRNRDGDRIQSFGATGSGQVQRSQGQRDQDRRGNGNGSGGSNRNGDRNNNQKYGNNRGQQYGNSSGYRSNYGSGSSNQRRFPDQASSPPCSTCGKLHPGKPCHRLTGGCFSCGVVGHRANECPKNKNKGGTGTQSAASGRVFAMTREQAARASGTITGSLHMFGRVIFVLFDTGATHSVVSISFAKHITIPPTLLEYALSISTPMKNQVIINHEYKNCPVRFDDRIRSANLFPLEMCDFNIILGMDWLTEHRATIDCHTKRVIFGDLSNPEFVYQGSLPVKPMKIISALKARTLISHGCEGFLASIKDTSVNETRLEDHPVVRDFSDVFPEELPGIPPEREVEFNIELIPGAEPISKAPYRMAPI